MPKERLGVVLLLPEPVATEIDGLRRACGDGTLGLVPPHITLVPPINVRLDATDDAVAVVRTAAARTAGPMELVVGPAATFAPVTPVLFLTVEGEVERLSTLRDGVLAGPLARPPEWPFVPHVTIAGDAGGDQFAGAPAALAHYRAVTVIDRVHLLREGDDRVWRPLADATFGPAAVIGRGGLPVELSASETLDPEAARFLAVSWRAHEHASVGVAFGPDRPFAVRASREGGVVGVAIGWSSDEAAEAVLHRLVVAPEARRQGVGSHLVAAVEQLAVARGCRRLTALAPDAGPAEQFFGARGWVVERPLPAWSRDSDFVRMTRTPATPATPA